MQKANNGFCMLSEENKRWPHHFLPVGTLTEFKRADYYIIKICFRRQAVKSLTNYMDYSIIR